MALGLSQKTYVYPEPPVYDEELAFLQKSGIKTCTPLSCNPVNLRSTRVGISISDSSAEELTAIGQDRHHFIQLSQDVARHLLSRGTTLIYGGDLRNDGFTDFIFREAQALQARLRTQNIHLANYIAWPNYRADDTLMTEWKDRYRQIAKMVEVKPPDDVLDLILDEQRFQAHSGEQNRYVWSRCLTEMRNKMIDDCHIRICSGGRHSGYRGNMPGVLEEVIIALKKKRSVFLLGGFGGVTASICRAIEGQKMPDELTEAWQIENDPGYKSLLGCYAANESLVDYGMVERVLKSADLNNGLSEQENGRLFTTPFIDETLHLVLKGLRVLVE